MALDRQTLVNQATPDANINELQSSNPKLYRAIKNIGDVLKTVINLSPLSGTTYLSKFVANFTAIAATPLVVVHPLKTADIVVFFNTVSGNLPTNIVIDTLNITVTFAANETGRVIAIG